jgi:hypothetical protein
MKILITHILHPTQRTDFLFFFSSQNLLFLFLSPLLSNNAHRG